MAQKSMGGLFKFLLKEAANNGELRDLLVDTGREEERPQVKIDGSMYKLGLLDGKPMLVKETDKSFLNPEMIGNGVHEILWKLKS